MYIASLTFFILDFWNSTFWYSVLIGKRWYLDWCDFGVRLNCFHILNSLNNLHSLNSLHGHVPV